MDRAWGAFSAKIQKLTEHHIEDKVALSFFENLLLRKDEKALSSKAQRDLSSIMSHYESAPGQNLTTAKGTLWGAVNAAPTMWTMCAQEAQGKSLIVRGLVLAVS